MAVSQNKRFHRFLLDVATGVVAGSLLIFHAAHAAPRPIMPEVQPLPPLPGTQEAPTDAPFPNVDGPVVPGNGAPPPSTPSEPDAPDFQSEGAVEGVDRFAPMREGTLDDSDGGLGYDLWANTGYEEVVSLMPRLPTGTVSPAVNELSRRLLLTIAPSPLPDPRRAGSERDRPFIALKLERLAKGGLLEDLNALIANMASASFRTKQLRVDALLMLGRIDEACGDASADRLATNDPYWIELRGLCYAAEGNLPGASLTLEVMRTLAIEDAPYMALIQHLAESAPLELPSLEDPTPVHLALLTLAKAPVPQDGVADADAGILLAIARSETTSIKIRLEAAEGAAYAGALPASEFATLLAMLPSKPSDLAALPTISAATVRIAALHYQNVLAKEGLAERAEAMHAALNLARSRGLYELYARVFGSTLWDLTPSQETRFFAGEATRALVLAGRFDRIADWANIMQSGSGDEDIADAVSIWLALAAPSAGRIIAADAPLSRLVRAARNAPPGSPIVTRAALTIGLFDALGYILPEDVRMVLVDNDALRGAAADASTMAGLTDAVRQGKRGLTVLHALAIIGARGPQQASPRAVIEAVAALSTIGLEDEARAIALEALLARSDAAGG